MKKAYLVIENTCNEYGTDKIILGACKTKKEAEEAAVKEANNKIACIQRYKDSYLVIGTPGFDLKWLYDYNGMMFLTRTNKYHVTTYHYILIQEVDFLEG